MDFNNQTILAPLTKGGNLPFRRLCADFGATMTVSEMAYARNIVKGEGRELALLRHHPSETNFGVQIAARQIDEAVKAARVIEQRGAKFLDINCGCPIHDTTRRGLGASMLQKPKQLGELVNALTKAVAIPITVKVRIGWSDSEINILSLSKTVESAGAAALIVHGRTREQRYTKAADWAIIGEVAAQLKIPVIGNGDILTYYEAESRMKISNCNSVMIGRGALIKPWIFQELKEKRDLTPSPEERVEIYYRLTRYMKEHFRDDEKGTRRAFGFLPWHFSFLTRYRPLPREIYEAESRIQPLIQSRSTFEPQSRLEQVLCSSSEDVHHKIALGLWAAASEREAVEIIGAIEIAPTDPSRSEFIEAQG